MGSSLDPVRFRWNELPFALDLDQVAAVLQCSRSTAWRLWDRGDLPGVRVSARKIRVSRDALRDWLASRAFDGGVDASEPENLDSASAAKCEVTEDSDVSRSAGSAESLVQPSQSRKRGPS